MPDVGNRRAIRLLCVVAVLILVSAAPTPATDLLDLYVRALELDPRFTSARLQVQIAEESIRETRSSMLPVLSGSAQISRIDQEVSESESLLFVEGRTDYRQDSASITLTQPLFRASSIEAMRQARSGVKQAGFELAAEEQELAFRVAEAHFNVLAAVDGLELARAERQALERQLADSEARLASGLGTATAMSEARSRAALARAAEVAADAALEAARQEIARITGSVPDDLGRLSETFPLEPPAPPDVEVWVDTARVGSPRARALEARAEVLRHDLLRERKAARLPSLDLTGSYTDSDSGGTEFGGGRAIASTTVGLRLNVPIYDGGRSASVVRSRRLRLSQALQELEEENRTAELETRRAFNAMTSEIARAEALRQAVDAQERVVEEKQELLRAGLGTVIDALDATREVYAARRDLSESRYRYILNRLSLERAAGTLGIDDLRWVNAYLQ